MSLFVQKISARLLALPEHERRQLLSFIDYLEFKMTSAKQVKNINSKPLEIKENDMKITVDEKKQHQENIKVQGKTEIRKKIEIESNNETQKTIEVEKENIKIKAPEENRSIQENYEHEKMKENQDIIEADSAIILQFLREYGLLGIIEEEQANENLNSPGNHSCQSKPCSS